MKKVSTLLAIVCFTLVPHIVFGLTVTVSDATGTPAQENIPVTIAIRDLDPSQNITGIDLCLDYSESALFVTKVENGALTAGWSALPNTNQPGKIRIGLYKVNPLTSSQGSILMVMFAVKAGADTATLPLHLSVAHFNEKPADTIQDGTFIISAPAKEVAPSPKPIPKPEVTPQK